MVFFCQPCLEALHAVLFRGERDDHIVEEAESGGAKHVRAGGINTTATTTAAVAACIVLKANAVGRRLLLLLQLTVLWFLSAGAEKAQVEGWGAGCGCGGRCPLQLRWKSQR